MLTEAEIKRFIDNDSSSEKKKFAEVGQRYYEANHDILKSRLTDIYAVKFDVNEGFHAATITGNSAISQYILKRT